MPTVTLSSELKTYLTSKNLQALVAEVAECKSCGGALADVYVRIPKEKEAQRLAESGCRILEAEGVVIYLNHRLIRVDETVELGLRSFFGIKDVTAQGLHL